MSGICLKNRFCPDGCDKQDVGADGGGVAHFVQKQKAES
jgi:hypothetical protein